jgi:hypothetical protein
LERELWDDDIADLLSILRRLIFLRYRPLVEQFSTGRCLDPSSLDSIIPYCQASVTAIYGDDERIIDCLGSKPSHNDEVVPFGYMVTLSNPANRDSDLSSQTDQCNFSIFATTEETAISKALTYARARCRGTIPAI